jgi:alpha-glucuronidase
VLRRLRGEYRAVRCWRDAAIAYFRTFSRLPLLDGIAPPPRPLAYYQSIVIRYAF